MNDHLLSSAARTRTATRRRLLKTFFATTALMTLGSCMSTTASAPAQLVTPRSDDAGMLDTQYAMLRKGGGKVFELAPTDSSVRIFAFRAGQAAKVGHNHVLSAPRFKGYFYLPTSGPAASRFDLEFRLDQLVIDDPALRGGLGSAFASVLTAEAIEGTREHMLGSDNLEADRFPFVRIHSTAIAGEVPKFAALVDVEMHGQTRQMSVPLTVKGLPDSLLVTGALVLRQSDFGAKPYSVLGGLLAVEDAVVVEFELSAR